MVQCFVAGADKEKGSMRLRGNPGILGMNIKLHVYANDQISFTPIPPSRRLSKEHFCLSAHTKHFRLWIKFLVIRPNSIFSNGNVCEGWGNYNSQNHSESLIKDPPTNQWGRTSAVVVAVWDFLWIVQRRGQRRDVGEMSAEKEFQLLLLFSARPYLHFEDVKEWTTKPQPPTLGGPYPQCFCIPPYEPHHLLHLSPFLVHRIWG